MTLCPLGTHGRRAGIRASASRSPVIHVQTWAAADLVPISCQLRPARQQQTLALRPSFPSLCVATFSRVLRDESLILLLSMDAGREFMEAGRDLQHIPSHQAIRPSWLAAVSGANAVCECPHQVLGAACCEAGCTQPRTDTGVGKSNATLL